MQGSRVVCVDFGSLIEMFGYLDLGFAQDYSRLAFSFGLHLSRHGSLQLWGIFTSLVPPTQLEYPKAQYVCQLLFLDFYRYFAAHPGSPRVWRAQLHRATPSGQP